MPIYEYICNDCRKVSSIFTRSMSDKLDPACSFCKSKSLQRKISRVVIAKGSRRYDDLDRSRLMGHYEGRDKASQAAWARRMAGELGEDGTEFREMAEKVEAGQDVWDLYDPAPMLDHKIESKKNESAGDAGESSHSHSDDGA